LFELQVEESFFFFEIRDQRKISSGTASTDFFLTDFLLIIYLTLKAEGLRA
jgi:hypothetical protein